MPRPCDIIVVGAGIVGCAIAHELTRRGASLQIVDGRAAGMGATQASAGILAPYIEAEGELLDLTVRSLDLFDEFVARIAGDSGIPIPYRRTGTLQVTTDAERWSALRTRASRLDAGHVPYEVRIRVSGRTDSLAEAVLIGNEVETLYTNGPAGGGGAFKSAREVIAVASVLVPKALASPTVDMFDA